LSGMLLCRLGRQLISKPQPNLAFVNGDDLLFSIKVIAGGINF